MIDTITLDIKSILVIVVGVGHSTSAMLAQSINLVITCETECDISLVLWQRCIAGLKGHQRDRLCGEEHVAVGDTGKDKR